MTLRPATLSDVPAIAAVYARAFDRNLAYHSIFLLEGDEKTRALEWLFARRLHIHLATGCPWIVAEVSNSNGEQGAASRVVGSVGVIPKHRRPSMTLMLWHGLASWPFVWGYASLRRALELDGKLSAGAYGHGQWEVSMMAVAPEAQALGVGAALLRRLLAEFDAASARGTGAFAITDGGPPVELVLSTQVDSNAAWYGRHGFTTVRKDRVTWPVGDPRVPFDSWTMRRPKRCDSADQLPGADGSMFAPDL